MTQTRPVINDSLNAFCKDSDAFLPGAADGPLAGLTFAAKDIFDVAGYVTGGGNPDWKATQAVAEKSAWAVQVLVDAGATMVGKTITDEITRGIFGENVHYGTPVNPRAPDRVPGGSSSGSASAVAGGLVDFALGSDSGGSVRIPASFCGLYGLRTTHGRISLDGVLPQAGSYDTVGWFARDIETFARVGAVLLQSDMQQDYPHRLVIAQDAFEAADGPVRDALQPVVDRVASLVGDSTTERLAPTSLEEWSAQQQVLQGREGWRTAEDWIDKVNPRFSFLVTERYITARAISDADVESAKVVRDRVVARMNDLCPDGVIVCLPTSPAPAPPVGQRLSERRGLQQRLSLLTCTGGTTGRPQISLPLAEANGLPVGLSLMGARGSDKMLIAFARQVAAAV
jgi:amidase